MPLEAAGRNAALSGLASAVAYISLHSAIPNSSGSNEATGVTRKAVTWGTSGGVMSNSAALSHSVPASTTIAAYGFWSAATAGTYYGWAPLNGTPRGFGEVDGTDNTNDTITSSGHGLANGDRMFVTAVNSEALPGGLTAGTAYWVIAAATDTFQISATQGGPAVSITGQGELYWQRIVPEVYASAGTLETATGQLAVDLNAL